MWFHQIYFCVEGWLIGIDGTQLPRGQAGGTGNAGDGRNQDAVNGRTTAAEWTPPPGEASEGRRQTDRIVLVRRVPQILSIGERPNGLTRIDGEDNDGTHDDVPMDTTGVVVAPQMIQTGGPPISEKIWPGQDRLGVNAIRNAMKQFHANGDGVHFGFGCEGIRCGPDEGRRPIPERLVFR